MSATVENDPRIGMGIRMDARLPFGKYRNFTVRAISEADPRYLDWLFWQDWFFEKYPDLIGPLPTESTAPPRAPIAFSRTGNVIWVAAWGSRWG